MQTWIIQYCELTNRGLSLRLAPPQTRGITQGGAVTYNRLPDFGVNC